MQNKYFNVCEYGAIGDGKTRATEAIQTAIDDAAESGGTVVFDPGIYLTGSLFVKSNVELRIDEGVEIRGIVDESAYPEMWSRVAGVEMNWPAGLINVFHQKNVKITGKGLLNGQGEYWWKKYWGEDKLGGMRKFYEAQGLRWAVDYDCKRPRMIIVHESSEVELSGLSLIRSPFWNVHICYSHHIQVNGLTITDSKGPSTDGVDIDSSEHVLVENCFVDCNDDNLCIKAGRDYDGLRVKRPCQDVTVRNCVLGHGEGITIGSETSGDIRNIEFYNIKANKTNNGFRLKSAKTRGGLIENIIVHDIEMTDVAHPLIFELNWHPKYSYCEIPVDYKGEVPEHWKVLAKKVNPPELGIPEFKNMEIFNLKASDAKVAFAVAAFLEKPIHHVNFHDIEIYAKGAGYIKNIKDWKMNNVRLHIESDEDIVTENCQNVELPKVVNLQKKVSQ
ncbi:glycoside hydrolase family 28 protein [Neobacillus sp. Marseille-QA0830]